MQRMIPFLLSLFLEELLKVKAKLKDYTKLEAAVSHFIYPSKFWKFKWHEELSNRLINKISKWS